VHRKRCHPQLEEICRLEWLAPEEVRERQQQYGYPNNDAVLERALQLVEHQ